MPSTRRTRVLCTVKPHRVGTSWLAARESSACRLNAWVIDRPKPTAALSPLLTTCAARSLAVAEEDQLFLTMAWGVDLFCSNQRVRVPRNLHQKQHCPDHRVIKRLQFDSLSLLLWQVNRQVLTLCRFDALTCFDSLTLRCFDALTL